MSGLDCADPLVATLSRKILRSLTEPSGFVISFMISVIGEPARNMPKMAPRRKGGTWAGIGKLAAALIPQLVKVLYLQKTAAGTR